MGGWGYFHPWCSVGNGFSRVRGAKVKLTSACRGFRDNGVAGRPIRRSGVGYQRFRQFGQFLVAAHFPGSRFRPQKIARTPMRHRIIFLAPTLHVAGRVTPAVENVFDHIGAQKGYA